MGGQFHKKFDRWRERSEDDYIKIDWVLRANGKMG